MFENGKSDLGCESLPVRRDFVKDDVSVWLCDRVGPEHAVIGEIIEGHYPALSLALSNNRVGESSSVQRFPFGIRNIGKRLDKIGAFKYFARIR